MTRASISNANGDNSIKFLYSYGGRIAPRPIDGELRYLGGHTRVLSVDRSITFSELMVKFVESCGSSMDLRCKLPSEDLDVLISVKSDEDLKNVIDEYDRASPGEKIRAILFPIKSVKKISPPSSPVSCFDFPSVPAQRRRFLAHVPPAASCHAAPPYTATNRCFQPTVRCQNAVVGRCHCDRGGSPRNLQSIRH